MWLQEGREQERDEGDKEGCEDREGVLGFANEAGHVLDLGTSCYAVKDTAGTQSSSQPIGLPLSLSTQAPTTIPGQWSLLARDVQLYEHM